MQILNYVIVILAIAVLTLVLGFALGVSYRKRSYEQSLECAGTYGGRERYADRPGGQAPAGKG